jgi:hypothetical protein
MIVGYSFKDVLRIPTFQGLTQFDLLQPKMDSEVLPHLFHVGADIDRPFSIQACKHRTTLSKVPVVGYRYAFFERMDWEWTRSKYCSMAALIHSQTDKTLAADMVMMSKEGLDWTTFEKHAIALERKKNGGVLEIEEVESEDSYSEDVQMMKSLRDVQLSVRGGLSADEDMIYV